jgi:DNA-binding SARP family transcriptional activator
MMPWMSRYAAWAFEDGVEEQYVGGLVRQYRWKPPSNASQRWPWPVKIYTLGRFEVLVDGQPLEFGRKAPKKPMALLKALIVCGGANVSQSRLLDMIWPDHEGDAAAQALEITLHRLRNWLKHADAIRQRGNRLSLSSECCWIDAWDFERGTGRLDAGALNEVLVLYEGSFLAQDGDASWVVGFRERLRSRYIRAATARGKMLETNGRPEDAIDLYLRAIEADDLVEPFYQGLMRCYQQLGRIPEAISAYRRLTQALSVNLGLRPGAASESLARSLRSS